RAGSTGRTRCARVPGCALDVADQRVDRCALPVDVAVVRVQVVIPGHAPVGIRGHPDAVTPGRAVRSGRAGRTGSTRRAGSTGSTSGAGGTRVPGRAGRAGRTGRTGRARGTRGAGRAGIPG